jgi:MFS family permease
MPVFQARTSFWLAGTVVALALWTSACPTLVYPLYQADWGVSTTTVTWIFAAYPIALIPVLILLGNISDHIGRRTSMILGLTAELVGVLFFVFAQDVTFLLIGRAFMGIGVGLSLSPASVAMVEFSEKGREKHAGAIATGISAGGIGLAMLVGGLLTQYAPFPLRLNYIVLAVVIIITALAISGLPRHVKNENIGRWRVRAVVIPRGSRGTFAAGAIAFASAFLVGAIVLPLGAKIASQLAGSTNALVTGALLAVFAVFVALSAVYARRLGEWTLVTIGALAALAGVWLYVATGSAHSLVLFFIGSAVAGASYAFNFAAGLTVFSKYVAAHHRASMTSGGYIVGYASQGIVAPILGWVVTGHGLQDGLVTGAVAFSGFFVLALIAGFAAQRATRSVAAAAVASS